MVDPHPINDVVRAMHEGERRQTDAARRLSAGGGGGTPGGVTDDALKPRVDFLHTAFLWLAGLMITALLAIVTVIFSVSGRTDAKIDKLAETVSALGREVGATNERQEARDRETIRRLDRIEAKLDAGGR